MKKIVFRLMLVFLVGLPLIYLLGVLLNRLVDPYGFYGTRRIEGFNAVKPSLHKRIRHAKAVRMLDEPPRQLILGTSRSEFGLTIEHPCWGDEAPFNASIPAGGIYEVMRFMQHAVAAGPVDRAVVSLDFFSFNAYVRPKLGDTGKWMGRNDARARRRLKYAELFSLDAIGIAWKTVRKQNETPRYWPDLTANPWYLDERIGMGDGHRSAFHESAADYLYVVYLPLPKREYAFQTTVDDGLYDTLACFRTLLHVAYEEDVELHLFLSPVHAWQLELIRVCGLWETFEDWKRQLVRIADAEAEAAGRPPFPLWDFYTCNALTTEPVPPAGDVQSRMVYSVDGSHFTKRTGELVLNRLFADAATERGAPEDFGTLLAGDMLEDHLADVREGFDAWRQSVPGDIAEIDTLWRVAQTADSRRELTRAAHEILQSAGE